MIHRIEIGYRENILDGAGESLLRDVCDLGITRVTGLKIVQAYKIDSALSAEQLEEVCSRLLTDPITQYYRIDEETGPPDAAEKRFIVEVWLKKGVTDATGDTVITGIQDLGFAQAITSVNTGTRYVLHGKHLTASDIKIVASKLLANPIIQEYLIFL